MRVLEIQSEKPMSPIWVVVPDRYQVHAFRRRLGAAGGAIGVHVGTFGHLYNEILWSAKNAPIAEMPGFLRALRSTFAELKLARVWPEVFLDLAKEHNPALAEIAWIYTEYQLKLGEIEWADPEGVNWLAAEALESDSSLFTHCPILVVDGFDSFEGAQRPTRTRIAGHIARNLSNGAHSTSTLCEDA